MGWMSLAAHLHGVVTPAAVVLLGGFPVVQAGEVSRVMLTGPAVIDEMGRRSHLGQTVARRWSPAWVSSA